MSKVTAAEVEQYLADNYLTLAQLAEAAGATEARLQALIAAQCVPPHSHEVRGIMVYSSSFGDSTAALPPPSIWSPVLSATSDGTPALSASAA